MNDDIAAMMIIDVNATEAAPGKSAGPEDGTRIALKLNPNLANCQAPLCAISRFR